MKQALMLSVFALALVGTSLSCNKRNPADATPIPPTKAGAQASRESEGRGEHADEGHAEHGREAEEPSALDQPLSELVGQSCEHGKKTYQCDECRYELGFVHLPPALVEGGLVTTTPATLRRIAAPIPLTGEIRFDERRIGHVSTQVEGIIKAVHVALGDTVKKGQPLVEIESIVAGEGQAAYLEAQGLLALARRSFERASELRKANISSEKELLQAKQELEAAEIRAAGAQSKLSRLGVRGTKGGRVVLRAPLAGTVLSIHAVPGELARADESLITVGDNKAVSVWADLTERDLGAVKKGQAVEKLPASLSVKAYPGEEFPGVVNLVSPAMDESSRTVKVRLQVDNGDGRLLAGMFATVRLFLPGADEALTVPEAAVLEDEGRSFVFVRLEDDTFVRRPVVPGRRWPGWVEIESGLEPSQVVVAEGAFLLKSDVLRSKMGAGCAD